MRLLRGAFVPCAMEIILIVLFQFSFWQPRDNTNGGALLKGLVWGGGEDLLNTVIPQIDWRVATVHRATVTLHTFPTTADTG